MRVWGPAALLAIYLFVGSALAQGVIKGRVVKVVDGDTVHVLESEKHLFKVRLGAIDAPERKQPFSNQSQKSLAELIAGKEVVVRWYKTDRYRRLVGSVYADGVDAGLIQVRRGM